jgi:UDP-N-acetylglucosamine 2-epimerase (non-hydrolysing)
MKVAPLVEAARTAGVEALICHTGQHYDERMSRLFFDELGMPEPFVNLEVGSGSHAAQTAAVMERFEPVLHDVAPDLVAVVGDVNSTLACALVAVKAHVPVAHVEAGLRSFDRSMPEEVNRVVTDAVSDLLYCSEPSGVSNLHDEGVGPPRVHLVGNVMIDTLLRHRDRASETGAAGRLGGGGPYAVVTLHRPANVDDGAVAAGLVAALEDVAAERRLLFPMHPRARRALARHGLLGRLEAHAQVELLEPLGYLEFLDVLAHADLVLTDSGGIQEETTVLGVPCLTLRPNTERPVTVDEGTNRVVGTSRDAIVRAALDTIEHPPQGRVPDLWDGRAAARIVESWVGGALDDVAGWRHDARPTSRSPATTAEPSEPAEDRSA